jgi:methionine-rich copper-binding protein CopC
MFVNSNSGRSGVRGLRAALAAVAVALGLALFAAAPASAHDSLVSADPAPNSTVTQTISSVSLTYSGVLLDLSGDAKSFAIQVKGPDGKYYEGGCVTLDNMTASATATPGEAGTYEVLWQVVSSDGHPVSGSYSFEYQPPAGTPVAKGASNPVACAANGSTPGPVETGPTSNSSASAPANDDAIFIGLGIGIVALAVIGVAIALLVTRRRAR